jgi:tetratricopeptide (TPR) repeat protein
VNEQKIDWEARVAACWAEAPAMDEERLFATIEALAAERPADDPAAAYERGSVRDSTGRSAEAVPFYRAALASERLDAARRPQATIQLASTLRLLGELDESERLLRAELERVTTTPDEHALPDQTRAFLALTLVAKGEPVEGAAHALLALAPHVTRYRRSIAGNAEELLMP